MKSTAFTPKPSAAFRVDGCRNRKWGTTTDFTRVNPASSKRPNNSPSGRAPPIQEAQSLGSFTIDWESCLALTMSVIEIRPPGFSTR